MLESSLFESQGRKKTRKPVTVIVSAMAHLVTVAVLVLIPLLKTQALTIPPIDMSLLLPRIQRPEGVRVFSAQRQPRKVQVATNSFSAPASIPQQIAFVDDPPRSDLPFLPSNGGSSLANFVASLTNRPLEIPAPELQPQPLPPLPPPPVIKALPLRQGGDVQAAKLIYQVKPEYPPIAKQTRTQGIVVLEATIDKSGSIDSLRVISGHPLLTRTALDAVKQWKYRPTTLNGEPIDVITTVTVTFTLQ